MSERNASSGAGRKKKPAFFYTKQWKTTRKVLHILRKTFAVIFATLTSLFLICVITGTIVATALTVYVLEFMEDTAEVDIYELSTSAATIFYAMDPETDEYREIYNVEVAAQRIPIKIDTLPQHVQDAFVFAEDENFYVHDGVDYTRTFAAFANMLLHFWDTDSGASTITQQLVKNLTGDDATDGTAGPARKCREIFRSMNLEQKYAKSEILEAYLNYVGFGGSANGIEMASEKYFGKPAAELSVAEAACLASIPKSPETLNPFYTTKDSKTGAKVSTGQIRNRARQKYVLGQMYTNGVLSYKDYVAALNEELVFTNSEKYKQLHPEEFENETRVVEQEVTPYIIDAAIYELADIFSEEYGISQKEARSRINSGGYRIYLTADLEMQDYLEKKYLDYNNVYPKGFGKKSDKKDENGETVWIMPNSSFICMDYEGNIKAVVGGIGEKDSSLSLLRPIQSSRQPGSCIKPIATYGLALEKDAINWSTKISDSPIKLVDGSLWPHNFGSWSYAETFVYRAIEVSMNTVPARLCQSLGTEAVFRFMRENMHITTLVDKDLAYSPLSVGGLTYGLTLDEMVNAFMVYGNGGRYYNSTILTLVTDTEGNVIVNNQSRPSEQAVSSQTAYVMNRLLRQVIENQRDGTGRKAILKHSDLVGKTGTTQNFNDLNFVGLTPDFVSGVWLGFDNSDGNNYTFNYNNYPNSGQIWYNIFGDYVDKYNQRTNKQFPKDGSVVEAYYCTATGMLAGDGCAKSAKPGYFKSSNVPPTCPGHSG